MENTFAGISMSLYFKVGNLVALPVLYAEQDENVKWHSCLGLKKWKNRPENLFFKNELNED